MRAREFIKESKSADLYHGTSLENAEQILYSDVLYPGDGSHGDEGNVSLSRSFSAARNFASGDSTGVVFVLDQELLSRQMGRRIKPHDWQGNPRQHGNSEAEEASYSSIPNIDSMIKQIIVIDRGDGVDEYDFPFISSDPRTVIMDDDKFKYTTTARQFQHQQQKSL